MVLYQYVFRIGTLIYAFRDFSCARGCLYLYPNAIIMETEKQFYEAPLTKVFEVEQEGIICASGDGEPINWGGGY